MTRLAAFALIAPLLLAASSFPAAAHPIAIVAAEDFYGDVAAQIGGQDVTVHSILTNPEQDPHLFETNPAAGRALSAARIVIYNGIGYDPWMPKLLRATPASGRRVIVAAGLIGRKSGDNPHIWYDPATMPALAKRLAAELIADDPAHKAAFEQRLARFRQSMQPVADKVAALRQRLAGTPVIATEPVFGDMFAALGMDVHDMPFQIAVMNDTEPAASAVAAFETSLRNHRVRLLVYNRQVSDAIATRMMRLAEESHVPVVGVTETEPPGKTYQAWILDELDAIGRALPR